MHRGAGGYPKNRARGGPQTRAAAETKHEMVECSQRRKDAAYFVSPRAVEGGDLHIARQAAACLFEPVRAAPRYRDLHAVIEKLC
jgi:hypothetical protein